MEEKAKAYEIGQPVLVQNQAGIFYGLIDGIDMKRGAAMLKDGFKLPSYGYVTKLDANMLEDCDIAHISDSKRLPVPTITDIAEGGIRIIEAYSSAIAQTSLCKRVPSIYIYNIMEIVTIADNEEVRESFLTPVETELDMDDLEEDEERIDNDPRSRKRPGLIARLLRKVLKRG